MSHAAHTALPFPETLQVRDERTEQGLQRARGQPGLAKCAVMGRSTRIMLAYFGAVGEQVFSL